jgi:hypothetical protein
MAPPFFVIYVIKENKLYKQFPKWKRFYKIKSKIPNLLHDLFLKGIYIIGY